MTKAAKAPAGLGKEGRRMYAEILRDYEVTDSAGLAVLLNAAQAADRVAEAREAIAKDGLFLVDRLERRYTHPAQAVEISASKALLAALRALKLEPGAK